jgi:hypothetical protein
MNNLDKESSTWVNVVELKQQDLFRSSDGSRTSDTLKVPAPRANFCTVLFQKTKVFVLGGDNADKEFSDIWELNLKKRTWRNRGKDLKEPLVGHKCVKLRVQAMDALVKGSGRGMLIYGGWQKNQYSDTLYLLDMFKLSIKECPRRAKGREEMKMPKSTFDAKKQIDIDLSIPEARRDHAFCFHEELNIIILSGGWNALEWHPDQVDLELWAMTYGNFKS